jgi:hypothetical protein
MMFVWCRRRLTGIQLGLHRFCNAACRDQVHEPEIVGADLDRLRWSPPAAFEQDLDGTECATVVITTHDLHEPLHRFGCVFAAHGRQIVLRA